MSTPPVQAWEIRFADADVGRLSHHVRAWVAADCAATTAHLYDVDVPLDGTVASMTPPELPRGRWAFGAESLNAWCAIHARDCVEVSVPTDGDTVSLLLVAVTPEPCERDCPCVPPPDGGVPVDAACTVGVDGGSVCPPGFTNCGTDTSCGTYTPVTYTLDRAGTLVDGCLALFCGSTYNINDASCGCGAPCAACLRNDDGDLTARNDTGCGSPVIGNVVPSGSTGCSEALLGDTAVRCCVAR